MKQFSFEITDTNNLEEILKEARDYINVTPSSAVLTHIYSGFTDRLRLEMVVKEIKRILPRTRIVGATAGGEIRNGMLAPLSIVVVITVFDVADVVVHEFTFHAGEEEQFGRTICETISATENIKACELFVDCTEISTATLFPEINKCAYHVQIYGAVPYAHDLRQPMFIFTDEQVSDLTVILVTYAGQ